MRQRLQASLTPESHRQARADPPRDPPGLGLGLPRTRASGNTDTLAVRHLISWVAGHIVRGPPSLVSSLLLPFGCWAVPSRTSAPLRLGSGSRTRPLIMRHDNGHDTYRPLKDVDSAQPTSIDLELTDYLSICIKDVGCCFLRILCLLGTSQTTRSDAHPRMDCQSHRVAPLRRTRPAYVLQRAPSETNLTRYRIPNRHRGTFVLSRQYTRALPSSRWLARGGRVGSRRTMRTSPPTRKGSIGRKRSWSQYPVLPSPRTGKRWTRQAS